MARLLEDMRHIGTRALRGAVKGIDALAAVIDRQDQVQRLAAQIRRLNRQRQEAITEIGKKVYGLYMRGKVTNKEIVADCQKVEELGKQIERGREEMERLRHGVRKETWVIEVQDESPLEEEVTADSGPAAEPATSSASQSAEPSGQIREEEEPLRPAPDACDE